VRISLAAWPMHFSRRYSDVNIALITTVELFPQTLQFLGDEAVAMSADWGPKVSLFWTNRDFSGGRFPPLDRIDYLDHGVTVLERERVRPTRPALEEVRSYLRGEPFTKWANQARIFAAAKTLEPSDRKSYLRAILYPARFCYSLMTGRMGSNDDAVSFLSRSLPAGLDVELIERALQCRRTGADPDSLFATRTALPWQIDACAALFSDLRSQSIRCFPCVDRPCHPVDPLQGGVWGLLSAHSLQFFREGMQAAGSGLGNRHCVSEHSSSFAVSPLRIE